MPHSEKKSVRIEIATSEKLAAYLDELQKMEGFGSTKPEIVRRFVWAEINRLIEAKRLKQK